MLNHAFARKISRNGFYSSMATFHNQQKKRNLLAVSAQGPTTVACNLDANKSGDNIN